MDSLKQQSDPQALLDAYLKPDRLFDCLWEIIEEERVSIEKYPDDYKSLGKIALSSVKPEDNALKDAIVKALLCIKSDLCGVRLTIKDIAELSQNNGHLIDLALYSISVDELIEYCQNDRELRHNQPDPLFSQQHAKYLHFIG